METLVFARFVLGVIFLFLGLLIFVIQIMGIFKMKYVLNRMHAAALGDTLGLGFSILGTVLLCGFNFVTFKILLVLIFMWFSSPVSSHLIARLEVSTKEGRPDYVEKKVKEKDV